MAQRKRFFPTDQASLFDILLEQRAELDRENALENQQLQEALHVRPSDSTVRNSSQDFESGNHQPSVPHRGAHSFSLFDFGQVGAEQSREIESPRNQERSTAHHEVDEPMDAGGGRHGDGTVLRHGDGWDEQVGDIPDYGHQHGAVKPKNYRITAEDALGKGSVKVKFRNNINAIALISALRERGAEYATEEEQKVLAKYVGWGGMPQAFDKNNEKWQNEYAQLKAMLSDEEYKAARRSTQDAHYTSETIIKAMYDGLERIGIANTQSPLSILEPAVGVGNFLGLKPDTIQADFFTVEQDILSADMVKYLYPEAHNIQNGFQNTPFKTPIFDVVMGNPPFGNQRLFDKQFPHLANASIHNYFIAKSLDLTKEGGVGAFVVSRFFLDAQHAQNREYIADKAHFLGAVRLPATAFSENALTEVTTDVVFFQKKTETERAQGIQKGHAWTQLGEVSCYDKEGDRYIDASINEYFVKNPQQVLGELQFTHGLYGSELSCVPTPDMSLQSALATGMTALPQNAFNRDSVMGLEKTTLNEAETRLVNTEYYASLKEGAFVVIPGQRKIGVKEKDALLRDSITHMPLKGDTAYSRISGMIDVRDALRTLINLEKSNAHEETLAGHRKKLNIKYDHFVKKYGYLNSQTNRALFKDDPEASFLQSLEVKYDKGISKEQAKKTGKAYTPPSATKAAIFTRRVLEFVEPAKSAESPLDALSISLRETGKIDFKRMANLLNDSIENVQMALQNDALIFQNPVTEAWEVKDKYLTGNVKEKLNRAKEYAALDEKYQRNVDALTNVIPKDIEAMDIGVRFGSTWLPPQVLSEFIDEQIGAVSNYNRQLDYIPVLGKWDVKLTIYDSTINKEVWGTPDYPADELIKSLLTNRPIKVEREVGRDHNNKPIMVIDQEATDVALQKAESIQNAFADWVWEDDTRREQLARIYNDTFNTHVTPSYDGSHIELNGASSGVELRAHQKDVVWRSIQEGTALFDHVVGAGKTLAAVATIKESKRMGFANKPMVVVPNHLVYQWRDEFYKLYPDANILVAEKTDFLKENRERFFSRVATGNWDAVIVAHSSFKKIDMPHEMQEEILQEQLDAISDAIENGQENASKFTIKQLEKQKERLQERFNKMLEQNIVRDKAVDFSDLGVDALFVDEAHEFKNLAFSTSMNVSGLGNPTGSAKALDLFVKCRYLQKQNEGKGVYFLTGTPISNTIAEVYTMQRYMQYDELKKKNLEYFDSWASTFGKVTSSWELDATGVNYRLKERFANFENVPELLTMYRTFADVVTASDIETQMRKENKKSLTPKVKGGKPFNEVVERSPMQAAYMEKIIHRMENLPKDPRLDNPLKITNDARKAGLDYRLIDPTAPDFANSKINVCAERIYELWQKTAADKGTQLVFCDLSTPKKKSSEVQAEPVATLEGQGVGEDIEGDTVLDMDEILAGLSTKGFSVYEDLKKKLIDKGIPAHEVAFIHDANTDQRKAKLFDSVNRGNVRVLMGSTAKMGAGMNAQERLVAAHHLDAPWRPADLEQRNGRIVRQGNKLYKKNPNFEVEIYNYATKQTYDARQWQTIEYKAAAIEQFRKGDVLQRSIDDVQSEASNAAEMKAAASGNPFILLEVNFKMEKRKLEALSSQYNKSKHRLAARVKYLQNTHERYEQAQKNYAEISALRDANTKTVVEDGKEKVYIEVKTADGILTAKDSDALKSLFTAGAKEVMRNRSVLAPFGTYRGFDVSMKYCPINGGDGFQFVFENTSGIKTAPKNLVYSYEDKVSLNGLFQRMDNFLSKDFDEKLAQDKRLHERELQELPHAQKELEKPFSGADELGLVRENHSAVLRELKKMQEDHEYVSEWVPKTLAEFTHEKIQQKALAKNKPMPDMANKAVLEKKPQSLSRTL